MTTFENRSISKVEGGGWYSGAALEVCMSVGSSKGLKHTREPTRLLKPTAGDSKEDVSALAPNTIRIHSQELPINTSF